MSNQPPNQPSKQSTNQPTDQPREIWRWPENHRPPGVRARRTLYTLGKENITVQHIWEQIHSTPCAAQCRSCCGRQEAYKRWKHKTKCREEKTTMVKKSEGARRLFEGQAATARKRCYKHTPVPLKTRDVMLARYPRQSSADRSKLASKRNADTACFGTSKVSLGDWKYREVKESPTYPRGTSL